ncbi:urease accessory protein UreF [Shimwellia pseudoproteus]|uniref:urease accessory protein UreF n=1 Tax=Shimwellia pseudoproteus TaxID=570012 RepID=UPI0018EC87E7|nr:urease accessory protein UreF [Shimwellia pseudoproteus]MBJ3813854.1 urease accessory protein UreF [Shimwellia pseudoproteus]
MSIITECGDGAGLPGRQWLRLMQLASGSLPVGAFTWSQGLEWAVEAGWVTDVASFERWQRQQMAHSFFTVDLPLLARLYQACVAQDLAAARHWTQYLLACRETRELRDEERSRGAAFTRLIGQWAPDFPPGWQPLFARSQLCGMAWLAVHWQTGLSPMALSLGYSWIEGAVMAGVKLVPFGQQAAQRLILSLSDDFAAGMAEALACPDHRLGAATPLSAIASACHETQYSRLFRS